MSYITVATAGWQIAAGAICPLPLMRDTNNEGHQGSCRGSDGAAGRFPAALHELKGFVCRYRQVRHALL